MQRIAFTIIYNGDHHLKHNNYSSFIPQNFDHWVIIEGASLPTGSTSWCKNIFTESGSEDNTINSIQELTQEYKNITYVPRNNNEFWPNKDEQVNAGIKILQDYLTKNNLEECFLWQIDIDEQWSAEQLKQAESELIEHKGKTGCFLCNYFVGPGLVAVGKWGEGRSGPYRRLWHWKGELFKTHEPPVLEGKNGPGLLLKPKFNHYAYFFEKDVIFKEKFYGYVNLVNNWKRLQTIEDKKIHISSLLDKFTNHWANTDTFIIKLKNESSNTNAS